jgi:NAD(P)-dependent dehydrogenase (short-subunit alcohol dehydrogenase family)
MPVTGTIAPGQRIGAAEEYITCNAICPGYVLTPLVEAQIVGWVDRETHQVSWPLPTRSSNKAFATHQLTVAK